MNGAQGPEGPKGGQGLRECRPPPVYVSMCWRPRQSKCACSRPSVHTCHCMRAFLCAHARAHACTHGRHALDTHLSPASLRSQVLVPLRIVRVCDCVILLLILFVSFLLRSHASFMGISGGAPGSFGYPGIRGDPGQAGCIPAPVVSMPAPLCSQTCTSHFTDLTRFCRSRACALCEN